MTDCPRGPHRPPAGPNEDVDQCPVCWALSWRKRPAGETYGWHAGDCAGLADHEGRCPPGGSGHPPAPVVRGYWPSDPRSPDFRGPGGAAPPPSVSG